MSDIQRYGTAKIYHDSEDNEVTLLQLIRAEPEWAESRINRCEKLESEMQAAIKKAQVDVLDRALKIIHTHSSPGHAYRDVNNLKAEIEL